MENNRQQFIYCLEKGGFTQKDIDLAMFAYDLSKSAHRLQKRDKGERFFEHPRMTALILLNEIGTKDINEVIAMLLHDAGEDTTLFGSIKGSYENFKRTAQFRLTRAFNKHVALSVIILTKPSVDGIYFKDKNSMMNHYITGLTDHPLEFQKKMIDRLHNLRSLDLQNPAKIKKQVNETRKVLLPNFTESHQKAVLTAYYTKRFDLLIDKVEFELLTLEKLI